MTKSTTSLPERVELFESLLIEEVLTNNNGSIKGTMDELMLARKTLYDKMKKYDLVREKNSFLKILFGDSSLSLFVIP